MRGDTLHPAPAARSGQAQAQTPLWRRNSLRIALVPVIALLVFVFLFDWNWLRRPLERYVLHQTGRELELRGDVTARWSFSPVFAPTFTLRQVRYANPDWAEQRALVDAEQISLTLPLRALFKGGLLIEDLSLVGVTVGLERATDGRGSWRLDRAQADPASSPVVRRVLIERGLVRFLDRASQTDLLAKVGAPAGGALRIDVSGNARTTPLSLRIDTVPADQLLDGTLTASAGIPQFRGQGRVGEAQLSFSGHLGEGHAVAGTRIDVRASGPDLSAFRPLARAAIPGTPPYRLHAQVAVDQDRVGITLQPSTFGESQLQGAVQVLFGGERVRVEGRLTASPLDFDDLGPLIGAAPGTGPGEKASAAQRALATRDRERRRVLPNVAFDTAFWPNVDLDLTLEATKVKDAGRLAIDSFLFRARLEAGQLSVDPLQVAIAGGRIDGSLSLATGNKDVTLKSKLQLRALKLERLLPATGRTTSSFGQIGGTVELTGHGRSLDAVLAGSNGRIALAMGPGEISNLIIELVGLDGGEALRFLLGGDRRTRVRCAVAALPVVNGQVRAESVVFDTEDTNLVVTGQADLRTEQLAFVVHPTPKDWSLFVLRSPIHLRGAFIEPEVSVDRVALGARLSGAVLLGLINPLAALLPLIETGGGTDADCKALLDQARIQTRRAARPSQERP